ncbi:MAG: chemotaxis protein CheB, partial [Deltaproteobacteria bacterium]|nr:chemotaxis protein CheB [Deltaproteobacteria bacterium]
PCDKERVAGGAVYVAPANYHLLVERDLTLSLSTEEPVHWSRPSIDVLFESAARAWGRHVVGVLLTGGNADGVEGLLAIRAAGGLTLVQDPSTAESPAMPRAAIRAGAAQRVLSLEEMAKLLVGIGREPQGDGTPQVPGLEEVQS